MLPHRPDVAAITRGPFEAGISTYDAIMVSVRHRVNAVKQPRGGYLNPRTLSAMNAGGDPLDHRIENLSPTLVGLIIDNLVRVATLQVRQDEFAPDPRDALILSLDGASDISRLTGTSIAFDAAERAFEKLQWQFDDSAGGMRIRMDDDAIRAVCKLSTFDIAGRGGVTKYNPEAIWSPDDVTLNHIRVMLDRSIRFFTHYGPITETGFTFADFTPMLIPFDVHEDAFKSGYTATVGQGDGDFLTADTLWDMKVSVSQPTKNDTLQVLMYFLMGRHSGMRKFATQTHAGIYNPRLDTAYRIAVDDIAPETIETIEREVIGYES